MLGRLLFEVHDRLDPAFGDPPAEDDLSLPESVAWQVYCVGRLGRLGHQVQRQRRLYHFRNRHGFTDAADEAFDRLWSADGLTWADITGTSAGRPCRADDDLARRFGRRLRSPFRRLAVASRGAVAGVPAPLAFPLP